MENEKFFEQDMAVCAIEFMYYSAQMDEVYILTYTFKITDAGGVTWEKEYATAKPLMIKVNDILNQTRFTLLAGFILALLIKIVIFILEIASKVRQLILYQISTFNFTDLFELTQLGLGVTLIVFWYLLHM